MKRTKDEERMQFAARLRQAYAQLGDKKKYPDYGKYSVLSRELDLTPSAVKRWFVGETIPISRINDLARLLDVRAEWLLSNKGPMKEVEAYDAEGSAIQVELHRVPVVEPEHYEEWRSNLISVSSHVIAEGKLSSNAFAFELRDNSALPLAMRGMMAVVDPEDTEAGTPVSAQKLIVVYDQGTYLLGRYIKHGQPTIEPENKDYKPVQLTDNHRIVGVLSLLAQRRFK